MTTPPRDEALRLARSIVERGEKLHADINTCLKNKVSAIALANSHLRNAETLARALIHAEHDRQTWHEDYNAAVDATYRATTERDSLRAELAAVVDSRKPTRDPDIEYAKRSLDTMVRELPESFAAEFKRVFGDLITSHEQFRAMYEAHDPVLDSIATEAERLRAELAAAQAERDEAIEARKVGLAALETYRENGKRWLETTNRMDEEHDILGEIIKSRDASLATLTAERDSVKAAASAARANWDRTVTERDEARREIERMREQHEAIEREADRLRHGVPIEGDFVCPDSLALIETRREIERWRPVIEAAKAWRANDVGGDHGRDLFIPSVESSTVLRDALDTLAAKERDDG